jgi:hypothetical protein
MSEAPSKDPILSRLERAHTIVDSILADLREPGKLNQNHEPREK